MSFSVVRKSSETLGDSPSLREEEGYDAGVPKLSLYYYPSCYYCGMVRRTIDQLRFDIELRDIHQERKWRDELIAARGRRTVPVLRIETDDGRVEWMGESRDIIHHLELLAGQG